MRSLVLFAFLNILLTVCFAKTETNETHTAHNGEKSGNATAVGDAKPAASSNNPSYAPAPSFLPTDFWRSGLGQTLSVSGIIATGVALIAGLTWLVAPFFGLRMCNLFGNCEKNTIPYNSGGNLQDPNLQNGVMNDAQYMHQYNNIPSYYKRSVDIVGPIFKHLASAVDKIEKVTNKS